MKRSLGVVAALALLGASLFPTVVLANGCSRTAFLLEDVQGVYDGLNIEMNVFPCGGMDVHTGTDGFQRWVGSYYGTERLVDGSIVLKYMEGVPGISPLMSNGTEFKTLVIKPDVPGTIHLWGVTPTGAWFDIYLDKTSDDPYGL